MEGSPRVILYQEDDVKFTYFCSTGASDPTRASIPFHLAVNGSLEVGHEVELILGGDATDILIGDNAEKIEGLGLPPMRDLLAKVRDKGIPVYI